MVNQGNNQTEAKQEETASGGRLTDSIGMALPDGRMRIFLPKGSLLPCEYTQRFLTRLKEFNKVRIQIYAGENEYVDDNYFMGEIGLENIRLNKNGEALLDIHFSINSDNLLKISLKDAPAERTSLATLRLPSSASPDAGKPGKKPDRRSSSSSFDDELIEKLDRLEQKVKSLEQELIDRYQEELDELDAKNKDND
jgi:molecular chaperone DnaK (HSP70)